MADYLGTGALFVNHGKEGKQPDYSGELEFDGAKYSLAAWKRTSAKGNDYLSVVVGEFREKQVEKPKQEKIVEDIDDEPVDLSDIPF